MLKALEDYSKALAATSNAKDRAEFDAASTTLASSSVALAGLFVGGPQGAAAGAIIAAVVELARYGVAVSFDARRFRVLRCVVLRSQPAVEVLGPLIGADLDAHALNLRRAYLASARGVSGSMALPRPPGTWDDNVARLQSLAVNIEKLNHFDGLGTAEAMVKAHTQLAASLRADDGRQLGAAAVAVGDFADKASALQQATAKR